MKRLGLFILALVMTAAVFSGCGNTNQASTTTATTSGEAAATTASAPDLKGKTVTIGRWGGNDGENAAFAILLANFTADTGIKTEEKVYTDVNTQLKADLIAGTAPDVFYVDAYMAPFYIDQGVLAELDPAQVDANKFYPTLIGAFSKGGKIYGIPKDYSTLALYYNKKWISESDLPKTQEELYSAAYLDKIQAKLPQGVAALTYNQDIARLLDIMQIDGTSVLQADGKKSNLADPKIAANIKPIFDAAAAKKVVTPADLGTGWNGEAFGNEKTAMMIEGNWVLGTMKTQFPKVDFGVAEVPTYMGKKTTMEFTVSWSMNAATKNKDAALAWIKYATGPKGMLTWCTGAGVLPSRSDVAETMGVDKDPKLIPHVAGAQYATPWQKGVSMDIINKEFQNYFNAAVKGEMTLSDMMQKAQDQANSQIQ